MFKISTFLSPLIRSRPGVRLSSTLPTPPLLPILQGPADWVEARKWVNEFKNLPTIPKSSPGLELSFSRSSGPGGQNVNKVNTKATLRCSLSPNSASWIPPWAVSSLKASPYYVASTNSILVSSSAHRSQSQNVDECLNKLYRLVVETASAGIRNETSEDTKKRVEGYEKAMKERNRKEKTRRSSVKQFRGKGKGGWD